MTLPPKKHKPETTSKQKQGGKNNSRQGCVFPLCAFAVSIFSTKEINARLEGVRWATICRRALMCSLQPSLKSSTPSSSNKGNKIRAKKKDQREREKKACFCIWHGSACIPSRPSAFSARSSCSSSPLLLPSSFLPFPRL